MSRRPGRPPKEKPERKIPVSRPGRLLWREGQPHPLDALFQEEQDLHQQVRQSLREVEEAAQTLNAIPDLTETWHDQDRQAEQALGKRFRVKHQAHLESAFAILRLKRQQARLQAAKEALTLARDLMIAQDGPAGEILAALDAPAEAASQEGEEPTPQDDGGRDLDAYARSSRPVTSRLHAFTERVQAIRTWLTRGNGWLESFEVTKWQARREAVPLLRAAARERELGKPFPQELLARYDARLVTALRAGEKVPAAFRDEVYEPRTYGPYWRYRWREGTSPIYTVHLGRLDAEAVEDEDEDSVEHADQASEEAE